MNMAERLQDLRKKSNYSQEQVADILGISRQAISKWESGQVKPEIDNIIKLVEIYHVSADYILLGKEEQGIVEPPKKREWSQETKKAIRIIAIMASMAVITVLFIVALNIFQLFQLWYLRT